MDIFVYLYELRASHFNSKVTPNVTVADARALGSLSGAPTLNQTIGTFDEDLGRKNGRQHSQVFE